MRNFRNDPAFAQLTLSLLNPLNRAISPFAGAQIADVPAIEESISNVFEVGYKGIIGERLLLAADVWHEKQTNFTSPLILRTPLVLMNPQQLGAFLVPRLTAVFSQQLPPAQAQQQAANVAEIIAQIPGGVVSSPDIAARGADLLVTYVNFGELELTGVDVGATALLTDRLQLGVTGSLVSDDHFNVPLVGQDTQLVALNAPKKKASVNLAYRQAPVGWNGEFRVRYTDEFPVNSADFIGIGCVTDAPNDEAIVGECIKSYTLFDVTAGYAFPTIPGASVSLSVQNLFNEAYQSFLGVPAVGRMALLRFKYEFGGRR